MVKDDFYVIEILAAKFILRAEFSVKFIEAIKPRKRVVGLEDGSAIRIIRKAKPRKAHATLLLQGLEFQEGFGTLSSEVRCTDDLELMAQKQTFVNVMAEPLGVMSI